MRQNKRYERHEEYCIKSREEYHEPQRTPSATGAAVMSSGKPLDQVFSSLGPFTPYCSIGNDQPVKDTVEKVIDTMSRRPCRMTTTTLLPSPLDPCFFLAYAYCVACLLSKSAQNRHDYCIAYCELHTSIRMLQYRDVNLGPRKIQWFKPKKYKSTDFVLAFNIELQYPIH